ncbi:uncharacterized protein LOC122503399 [Leptopilina heterotoma]|uniref:uncharacterized protein LOC122503399 n=1 Tax=Leptopilina heterotoma TaxID=63436 RepID=UPI001CA7D67A|nr:uncharacterized protein LOC122503399 [Leptopilina heterotoma]
MVSKFIHLFGTIILLGVGLFNYYIDDSNYIDENVTPTFTADPNQVPKSEMLYSNTSKIYRKTSKIERSTISRENETIPKNNNLNEVNNKTYPQDINIKNHLKTAIEYFDKLLNLEECNERPNSNNLETSESNFTRVLTLISDSALNYYVSQKGYIFFKSLKPQNIATEILKLMPLNCEPQLNANKEIFETYNQVFKEYYRNFPNEYDDPKYSECYLESILELKNNILSNSGEHSNRLQKIKECIALKEKIKEKFTHRSGHFTT